MPDLGTDQLLLLKDGDNHDLVLVCEGGERLEVHRIILAARSAVLKRMTEVDMRERNTGTIEIKDFEPGVVKEFTRYLYSDMISADFSDLAELMRIGHQYEVSSLVDMCSGRLVQEVSLYNVNELGTLAETLEANELSGKCAEVLANNFEHFDTKTLDSVPSSLLRKSLAITRRKMLSMDQNTHYMANFFTNHGKPESVNANRFIFSWFSVSRETKLAGIGLYLSEGNISIGMTIDIEIYAGGRYQYGSQLLTMTATVTSTDLLNPLKIIFPAPVKIASNASKAFTVKIKFGTGCVNFSGDAEKPSVSLSMKTGELNVVKQGTVQIPVLYFED